MLTVALSGNRPGWSGLGVVGLNRLPAVGIGGSGHDRRMRSYDGSVGSY